MMARTAAPVQQQQRGCRIRSASDTCPYRSTPLGGVNLQQLGTPEPAYHVGLLNHPASFTFLELAALVSQSRTRYKRGPPTHL